MSKVTTTDFDHNYHYSVHHYDSQSFEEYIRHEVDVYNQVGGFWAIYQTGCSYRHGDYSMPSQKLELSDLGCGTDRVLEIVNSMCEGDFDDAEYVEEKIAEIDNEKVKNADELWALYEALRENLFDAQCYMDGLYLDDEPTFIGGE